MKTCRIFPVLFLVGLCWVAVAGAQEPAREAIPNWPAPANWSPTKSNGGLSTLDLTSPLPFIALAPCRIVDTRGNGAPITGGMFTASELRNYAVAGICGIPGSARALSLNITVTGPGQTGAGFLLAWPTGGAPPPVSSLNWDHVPATVGNAAVVPTNSSVSFTVNVSGPTHVIIDVNGYYGGPTADITNVFLGPIAGNSTMTGSSNVGIGLAALTSLTSGTGNTATGRQALASNDSGSKNTAFGYFALDSNSSGVNNTAVGDSALVNNSNGSENTAVGESALLHSVSSIFNTGVGSFALQSDVDGGLNVAIGHNALANIASSIDNIAVGTGAALNLTSGDHNIHIGNPALSSESNTIRIGAGGTHTKFFVAGVRGVTTGIANAVAVVIDGGGQLGTISSSARVKREIADIGEESSALLKLRPVSFLYRNDTIGFRQYGLIAEEVAEVMPDLVQFSEAGEPEMVRYHFLPPLLLNELQKQQGTIEKQQKTIENQNEVIAGLEARLARLEARLSTESGR